MFNIKGKYTSALLTIDNVENETVKQIYTMVNHPAAVNQVAIMPDCHAGKGCVVGFTMKASDMVVPNWVGVDVGCGMRGVKLNIKKSDLTDAKLAAIDVEIRKCIPMGMSVNEDFNRKSIRSRFCKEINNEAIGLGNSIVSKFKSIDEDALEELFRSYGASFERFYGALGSLGGGNHFIEGGVSDADDNVWIVVHTGSRNFGKRVCEHFDDVAINSLKKVDISDYIKELYADVKLGKIRNKDISDLIQRKKKELKPDFDIKQSAYLTGSNLTDYLEGMFIAQTYAKLNREFIIKNIVEIIGKIISSRVEIMDQIETVHNFISFRDNTIRKGAVESYKGERIIIPFNMRDGILICEGKSNPDWNCSAPHGAGRVFSRSQAKQQISMEDFKESMKGIFTTSVGTDTLDESPMAYKDASMIEEAIKPTADILFKIMPIYNVKAGGE
jgi:RNA-splicing ligase RtcB